MTEAICDEHEKFEVSVGICGATGAGKTTMINALLGHNDLLPSGSEGASTGTVCVVHDNKDTNEQMRFRASVKFKSRANVTKWLDKFFRDFRAAHAAHATNGRPRKDGEKGNGESYDEDDDFEYIEAVSGNNDDMELCDRMEIGEGSGKEADEGAESEDEEGDMMGSAMQYDFSDYTDPIYAVWKLDEGDLQDMSTADILTSADFATQLLSTTKLISCQDLEAFAEEIKPYLDCTPLPGVETANGEEILVWPLVQRVDLYIPSPILENGVVIEDLPGLSDCVAMRANVARERFGGLDITIIVSPVVRASDEQLATQLITDNEAMHMELNGKFNRHRFCVVTSKTDDMPWQQYVKKTLRPAPGTDIHTVYQGLKDINKKLKDIQSDIADAKNEFAVAKADLKLLVKCNGTSLRTTCCQRGYTANA